uniref:NADH-ubiquinone oxidoreductase chain 4 n=1 Tax=Eubranchipus grubii TaxID=381661 RepID=A0A7D7FDU4_9CRUS|nr:NADH dehydrogenase subunit 4 [Eubranchipus grubii]QMP96523.1 NADH dehydrogenase subunit 4 [Eubranchipus grubii]
MVSKIFAPSSLSFYLLFIMLCCSFKFSWSHYLLILSMWIFYLMVVCWSPSYKFTYLFLITSLLVFLILTFTSVSLVSFYIFFESSLIPTLLLIMGWGYQPERLPASLYFLFYTLVASLPLLFILLSLEMEYQTSVSLFLSTSSDSLFVVLMILAFLVKLPMYFTHIWLPKAHVEAPVTGSMVLAAILLKLGGYGLFLVQPLMGTGVLVYLCLFAGWGGVLSCLLSLRQTDVKSLIAYSSVAHMAYIIFGMLFLMSYGNTGSLLLMVAHGLCSSGLFYLSYTIYNYVGSRSFLMTRGILVLSPFVTLWWFLLIIFNMGVPPSLNLFSELYMFIASGGLHLLLLILAGLISFLSACYCLFLYSWTSHGETTVKVGFQFSLVKELLVGSLHFIPLLLLITI